MIRVELKNWSAPFKYNPSIDTEFECEGVLLRLVAKQFKYIFINDVSDLLKINFKNLISYPAIIRWNNDIINNISDYKIKDLIYYNSINNNYCTIITNNKKFRSI